MNARRTWSLLAPFSRQVRGVTKSFCDKSYIVVIFCAAKYTLKDKVWHGCHIGVKAHPNPIQLPFPYSSKTVDSQFRKTWLGVAINFPINWILCRDLGLSISVGHDWIWYISNIRDFLAYRGSAMRGGLLNILISNSSSSNSYSSIWIRLNPSILYTYTVFYHYQGIHHCCLTISRCVGWVW